MFVSVCVSSRGARGGNLEELTPSLDLGSCDDHVQRSAPKVLHPPRKGSSVGLSHTSQKSVIALHICLCFTYKFTWPYDSTERANAYIHSYMKGVPVDQ